MAKQFATLELHVTEIPVLREHGDRSPLAATAHGLLVELEERAARTTSAAGTIRHQCTAQQLEILYAVAPPETELPPVLPLPLRERIIRAWSKLNPGPKRKPGRPRKVRA